MPRKISLRYHLSSLDMSICLSTFGELCLSRGVLEAGDVAGKEEEKGQSKDWLNASTQLGCWYLTSTF
jgi:hypothetical protein